MADIKGLHAVRAALQKRKRWFGRTKPTVIVGYTADYAVYVHENLKARHAPGKSAKFLEQPAREKSKQIAGIIEGALKVGATLEQSLLLGGQRLQRESQRVVPIDTGNLKGSAFTEIER